MVRLLPCSGWWPTKIASLSAPIIPVVVFSVRFGHPEWSDCLWKSSRNGGTCQKDHKKRDTGLQLFSSEKKNVLTWWFVWIFIPAQQPVSVLLMWLLMMVRVHVRNMDDVASRMIMSVGSAVRLERREQPNWRRTAAVSSAAGWSSDSVWKARTFLNGTPWKELVTRRRQPEYFGCVHLSPQFACVSHAPVADVLIRPFREWPCRTAAADLVSSKSRNAQGHVLMSCGNRESSLIFTWPFWRPKLFSFFFWGKLMK